MLELLMNLNYKKPCKDGRKYIDAFQQEFKKFFAFPLQEKCYKKAFRNEAKSPASDNKNM